MDASCKNSRASQFKIQEYKQTTLIFPLFLVFITYILKITYFQLNCSSKFTNVSEKHSVMLFLPTLPHSRSDIA
jgi:hypothetical protein